MNGMKNKWYINSIEVQPYARRVQVVYTNGFDRWVKHFDINDSCIPTSIDEEED